MPNPRQPIQVMRKWLSRWASRWATISAIILATSLSTILGWSQPVQAVTQIKLSHVTYKDCSAEQSQGAVTSNGSSLPADCYLIIGQALNTTSRTVYDADVYGRIYDATNNPILENRSRVGSISEIPPGTSDFSLRISVPANQPTPLKLEQFKASGFTNRVGLNLKTDSIQYEDELSDETWVR
jgi:hypothetical protein